jgi:transcriptional regulator GlxA family with amidase domain
VRIARDLSARDPIPAYVHLLRAKDLMDRSFGEPLDVRALAREAFASEAHFIRSFRSAFGDTPHRYLTRRRVERAKELLRATDDPVTEISLCVGFRSLGTFSRTFRALVGESPSGYRAAWRARGEPAVPFCHTLMWDRAVPEKPDGPGGASVAA